MAIALVMHGAAGRMGQRIIALSQEDARFQLVGAVEHAASWALDKDAGEVAGGIKADIPIVSRLAPEPGQVVIDFSLPGSVDTLLRTIRESKASLVCGTTGLQPEHVDALRALGQEVPVLYSPNMSVGVNLLFLAAQQMARQVGEDFDIEIFEAHHRFKKDAPSGTALRLAELIAEAKEQQLNDVVRHDRSQHHSARTQEEIGMQAMRGGDIVGEHTVFYCGMGERLELTHRATSRDIFARGALRAAAWLAEQPAGFYSMFDVLAL